jgi:SAM-dependent methyltransferase
MPVTLGHVVTELQSLPFRTGAFDGMCCVGALERAHDGVALVNELGRVVRRGGAALFVASIRLDASIARMKIRDRLIGLNRPQRAYLHSAANVREYSSGELSWLVDPMFRVRSWNVLGWDGGWKGRLASTVRRLPPFERFASAVAIDAERK